MKKQSSTMSWVVVMFFTLFMTIYTFNLVVYPACAVETMALYGIEQTGLTTFASVTSVVGLVAGFIFGPLIDKKGSRGVILVGMIIGIALFVVRAFVTSFILAIVMTFLASFFIGVCQVAAPKVLDTWFTKDKVGVAVAFQAGGAGLGSAVAFLIGAQVGLKTCLLIIAAAYAVLLVVWIFIGRDGPVAAEHAAVPKGGVVKVYKSRYVWLISVAYACCVSATMTINTCCIPAFIGKGMAEKDAAMMGTVINLALFTGGYFGTWLMSVFKRYNLVLTICVAGGAIGYLLGFMLPVGTVTWVFMIIGAFIMGGGILMCVSRTPLIPLTGEFEQECIGTAAGALETIKGVIAFVLPIVITAIFPGNYAAIFISFAVLCALAFLTGSVFVPEVGPNGKLFKEAQKAAESK